MKISIKTITDTEEAVELKSIFQARSSATTALMKAWIQRL